KALEAVDEQVIVEPRPALVILVGNPPGPETETARRRPLPRLAAVVLPHEPRPLVDEDRVEGLARLQFPAGGGAAARVSLDLVFRHGVVHPSLASRLRTVLYYHAAGRLRQESRGDRCSLFPGSAPICTGKAERAERREFSDGEEHDNATR